MNDNAKTHTHARNQGEGDRESARRYDDEARTFAESGEVDRAARNARPRTPEEAERLRRAEAEGRARAKGEDPAVSHGSGGHGDG
ncbi:MAG: hypothetical protein GC151_05060 [Betaproteobacteria bacterium]|nr:hypothetical protein [Betaproteobacteria bacterium]